MNKRRVAIVVVAAVVVALVGCGRATPGGSTQRNDLASPPRSVTLPTSARRAPARDLTELVARTARRFVVDGDRASSAHDAVAVTVGSAFAELSGPRGGLRLGPASVGRGGASAACAGKQTVDELTIARDCEGPVREVIESTERGFLQEWTVAMRPAGVGDLVVRVPIEQGAPIAEEGGGVRFVGASYGVATWVDANDRRTTVPVHLEDGALTMRVPASVLLRSVYPAVLDPAVSAELPVAPAITVAGAGSNPSVAYDGTRWLAVWNEAGVRGAFVDASGKPTAPSFPIASTGTPSVAWNGSQYLVVTNTSGTCNAVRVDTTGKIVDPAPIAIATGAGAASAIVSDGSNWIFAYSSSGGVSVARVSPTGALLGTTAIPAGAFGANSLSLSWNGSNFLVGWSQSITSSSSIVYAARVSAAGALVDATPFAISGGGDRNVNPCLASNGTDWLVTWMGFDSGHIDAARVTAGGTVLDGAPLAVTHAPGRHWNPTCGYTSSRYLLAWSDARLSSGVPGTGSAGSLWAETVGADGSLGGEVALIDANFGIQPRLVTTSTPPFLVWDGVLASRIGAGPSLVDTTPIAVSTVRAQSSGASVGFDGSNYLAAWIDRRAGTTTAEVFVARLDRTGVLIDTMGTRVGTDVVASQVAVSGGSPGWLVAWGTPGSALKAARLRHDASMIDAAPFVIASSGAQIALAASTSTWLATYQNAAQTHALTIGFDGALGSDRVIGASSSGYPSTVASDGSSFLVAWNASSTFQLQSQLLDASGAPVGAVQSPTSAAAATPLYASLGFDGTAYVLAWTDFRSDRGGDIYARRIDKTGVAMGSAEFAVSATAAAEKTPAIASDPKSVTVVYGYDPGAVGLRSSVIANGVLAAPSSIDVTLGDGAGGQAVASDGAGGKLIVYSRNDAADGATRVYARLLSGFENGHPCSAASGCLAGFCVDGVCCNTPCTDTCAACDVIGSVGTCTPVSGTPHGSRGPCSGVVGGSCGQACDGARTAACSYPPTSVTCGVDACTGGTETHAGSCDGAGKCTGTTIDCAGFACDAKVCKKSCTLNTDCASGYFCSGAACMPLEGIGKPCKSTTDCVSGSSCTDGVCCASAGCGVGSSCNGVHPGTCSKNDGGACAADGECGSGFCVDGVCCESACKDQCKACGESSSPGKCVNVDGPPRGARSACSPAGADSCAVQECSATSGACTFKNGTAVECGTASCEGGSVHRSFCDGAGACKPAAKSDSCGAYACDPATHDCKHSCSAPSDCDPAFACKDGNCAPIESRCSPDGNSSIAKDGTTTSCGAYKCLEAVGVCLAICKGQQDCQSGACDSTGHCSVVDTGGSSGGCALSGRSSSSLAGWTLTLLAGLLFFARRRSHSHP